MTNVMTNNVETTGTSFNSTGLTIRDEDKEKIILSLIKTYSSPITPLRETVVNALEVSDKVNVIITATQKIQENENNLLGKRYSSAEYSSGTITVEDFGQGMSEDFVRNFLLGVGASTKDQDETQTGGFGIGFKSVLSISEQVNVKTTQNGITTVMVLSLVDNRTSTFINNFESDLPNGTVVTIPVNGETITRILDRMNTEYFDYVNPDRVNVTVNGESVTIGKYNTWDMKQGDILKEVYTEWGMIKIIGHGGIPYNYKLHNFYDKVMDRVRETVKEHSLNKRIMERIQIDFDSRCAIRFDVPKRFINPNREGLEQTDVLDGYIIDKMATHVFNNVKNAVDYYESMINDIDKIRDLIVDNTNNKTVKFDNINDYQFTYLDLNYFFRTTKEHINAIKEKNNGILTADMLDNTNIVIGKSVGSKNNIAALTIGNGYNRSKYYDAYEKNNNIIDLIKEKEIIGFISRESEVELSNNSILSVLLPSRVGDKLTDILTDLFKFNFIESENLKKEVYSIGKKIIQNNPDLFPEEEKKKKEIIKDITVYNSDKAFATVNELKEWLIKQDVKNVIVADKHSTYKITNFIKHLIKDKFTIVIGDNLYSRLGTSIRYDKNVKFKLVKIDDDHYHSIIGRNIYDTVSAGYRELLMKEYDKKVKTDPESYKDIEIETDYFNFDILAGLTIILSYLDDDHVEFYSDTMSGMSFLGYETIKNNNLVDTDTDVVFTFNEFHKIMSQGLFSGWLSYKRRSDSYHDKKDKSEILEGAYSLFRNQWKYDKKTISMSEIVNILVKMKKIVEIAQEV